MVKSYRTGLFFLFIASFCVIYGITSYFTSPKEADKKKLDDTVSLQAEKADISILVLGVDERGDDAGRSDVVLVVKLTGNGLSITQIPRDTFVEIPGVGFDKINHAYNFGGIKLSKKVVEKFTDKPVHYTAVLNLAKLREIIDLFGGVEIEVKQAMDYDDDWDDNNGLHIHFKPGTYKMSGLDVERYIRYRDEEGDIGRLSRQKEFMIAFIKEIASPLSWPSVIKVATSLSSNFVDTTLTSDIFLSVCRQALLYPVAFESIKGHHEMIADISYWVPDIEEETHNTNSSTNQVSSLNVTKGQQTLLNQTVVSKPSLIKSKDNKTPVVASALTEEKTVKAATDEDKGIPQEAIISATEKLKVVRRLPPGDPNKMNH